MPQTNKPTMAQAMSRLENSIGRTVTVEYVEMGEVCVETKRLVSVNPFSNIEIEGCGIPFLGMDVAIVSISIDDERVYENKIINADYRPSNREKYEYIARTFGYEIASRKEEDELVSHLKYKKEHEKKKNAERIVAKKLADVYANEGATLVKPELTEEWKTWVAGYIDSLYDAAIVEAIINGMRALSEGGTPEDAERIWEKRMTLSGFMIGCAAEALVHFCPQGDEFRTHWNSRVGELAPVGVRDGAQPDALSAGRQA